jgi:hypothetical protein
MIKHAVTLIAFLSSQFMTPQILFAQDSRGEEPPTQVEQQKDRTVIQSEFKKGVKKIEDQVKYENRKQQIAEQKKELKENKAKIKNDIRDNLVVLNARLAELNYLADYLDINEGARKLVARSIKREEPPSRLNQLAAVSAIIAVPSVVAYGIGRYAPVVTPVEAPVASAPEVTPTTPTAEPNPPAGAETANVPSKSPSTTQKVLENTRKTSASIYDSTRRFLSEAKVRKTTGIVAAVSVLTAAAALGLNYYLEAPYRDAASNLSRIYLSQLVTNDQNHYLSNHQIDAFLTERLQEPGFADRVAEELNTILNQTQQKIDEIHSKQMDSLHAEQEINSLEKQVESQPE